MTSDPRSRSDRKPVSVRLARASDAPVLGAQYAEFLASYGHVADVDSTVEFVSSSLGQSWIRFLVATDDEDRIVGFVAGCLTYSAVSLQPAFTINDLFVLKSERGRGIASALLAALEQYARDNRFAKMFVEAGRDAPAVIELYERAGFRIQPHVTLKKELDMEASRPPQEAEVFNYLSVLTSVVLGLGLTHLLVGYARLVGVDSIVSVSWIYTGWIALLLPLYFTYWWAFWDYRERVKWTFLGFSLLLAGPVGLYFVTALYVPDAIDASFDAHAHYLQVRPWAFAIWTALQLWGIVLAPWLKEGFGLASLANRYKAAQAVLLVALIVGYFNDYSAFVDGTILVIFWVVLVYILAAHRRQIRS